MRTEHFILARTNEPLRVGSSKRDTAAFRGELVERLASIHEMIDCAHSPGEGYLLVNAILKLQAPGPVVECGCYQGGMTSKLSLACEAVGRELYICDSFEGLPEPVGSGDYKHYKDREDVIDKMGEVCEFRAGQYKGGFDEVRQHIAEYGAINVCRFVPGLFSKTLPFLNIRPAMVTVDVDLIESGRGCLRYLWPRLAGRRFFTHEAFNQTYMEGILDAAWWQTTMGEPVPEVLGVKTGLNPRACCTAVLMKPVP